MDPVWHPNAAALARSRLAAFCAHSGCAGVDELRRAATDDPAWFWRLAADWLRLDWQRRPTDVVTDLDLPHRARWFVGGACNIADNAVDRWIRRGRGGQPALVWESEQGDRGCWTFEQLAAEVDRVGRGLLEAGVRYGDRVGIQLPMVREAVVATLACAKIGAVTVSLFSGFGADAVARRLAHAEASALICADGFPRRGRTVALRAAVAEVAARVPTLRTCVVVPLGGPAEPAVPHERQWDDLGRSGPPAALEAAVCPTEHPLMIAYTSGTTGAPKGVTLGHAGFAVKAGTDAAWCFDVGTDDVSSWITDPGWIMSPITVLGGLLAGSAVAVCDGAIDHPDPGWLWRFVETGVVTMLGVSPSLVRSLARHGDPALPGELGGLRVLASSGEPWTPDAFDWLFDRVGRRRLPIVNYSGGTEVSGAILSNTTMEPIVCCGFAGPVPGMAAEVADADGNTLVGCVGELVLRRPSPGMPLGFWRDDSRYHATYWSQWPGTWLHGDLAEVDERGVWRINGRSDDTLNVAGKRLGPAEIEQIVAAHPAIRESAAIGVPDQVKGEDVVVLAVPVAEYPQDTLAGELEDIVARALGRALRPRAVHLVADLSRTRSGKTLRRVIRALYLGEDAGDVSALDNPAALDLVRSAR